MIKLPIREKSLSLSDSGDPKINQQNNNLALEQIWNRLKRHEYEANNDRIYNNVTYVKQSDIYNTIINNLDFAGGFTGTITFVE
jgi:hypothetical protein